MGIAVVDVENVIPNKGEHRKRMEVKNNMGLVLTIFYKGYVLDLGRYGLKLSMGIS